MNRYPSSEDPVLFGYFERLLHPHEKESIPPAPVSGGADPGVCPDAGQPQGVAPTPDGCPAWIKERFQVQVFCLGKLRFAAPVAQLSGVFALEGEITFRPGQPIWASGQVSVAGRKVWVVRLAELILPGKAVVESYPWVLLPRCGEYALLCHEVEEPCWWRSDEIRWRKERISRPWLLGMHGDLPCPLIDVERLVEDLKR